MKRNLLFLLMTLVLPIGACAYDAYINGIYYNFSENEAEVTSSNNPGSYSGSLVIPEFVGKDEKTYRVTSIGEDAFLDCRTLTSIAIPNYLTHIGSGAFYLCKSLTEVHIKDMEAWCKITFGESHSNPLYYAKHLYMNGQEIKDLTIPDSIATINNYAFYNCSDLKTITLPGSITSIGHDAFYGCSSLTDVYCDANEVPEAVSSAFPYASLKSATLHVPAGSIDKYKAQSPWSRFGNIVGIPQEEYFPEGTKWTEIRLDTLKYDSWYSKVDGEWVPNFETIEYRVLGIYSNFSETFGDNSLKCVYTNCSEWTDSLSLLIVEGKINEYLNYGRRVMATVPIYFDSWDVPSPAMAYNFDWRVGMPISFIDILSTTYDHNSETAVFGIIEEINEGNFGGVRPLSYTDVNGVRFIQGIGVTTWNDGECIFGPVKPYEALSAYGAIEPEERHYRSMLVHFERDGEVLYNVWPEKETIMGDPVTYTAGQMATIILPTEPDASKGKYYRLDRYEDGQIIFEQELQPQAHIPYIIVPNEDFSIDLRTLDLTGLSRDTVSIAGISFIGSYVSETFDYPDSFYIDFIDITPDCRFDESCVIGALRAYLLVRWDDPYNQGGTRVPPLNKRGIVLRDYETGIKSVNANVNHGIYNLAGQRLSKPQKGIYIENGQKRS